MQEFYIVIPVYSKGNHIYLIRVDDKIKLNFILTGI